MTCAVHRAKIEACAGSSYQSDQHLQEGGLARILDAHDSEALVRGDAEADPVYSGAFLLSVVFGQIANDHAVFAVQFGEERFPYHLVVNAHVHVLSHGQKRHFALGAPKNIQNREASVLYQEKQGCIDGSCYKHDQHWITNTGNRKLPIIVPT